MSEVLTRLAADPGEFRDGWPDGPRVHDGEPSWARSLLNFDAVDTLIAEQGLAASHVAMADGAFLPAAEYSAGEVIDPHRLGDRLRAGCTLLMHGLHTLHAPLADLCREVVAALGHPVQANAYLTPPDANGFAHHWDGHSGFLIQTEGTKHWQLFEPVVTDPLTPGSVLSGQLPADFGERAPAVEVDLRAGDVLWIPRGWIHNGVTGADWSLHVTIGVRQFTPHGLLGPLLGAAAEEPALRAALPPGAGHDDEILRTALAESLRVLVDWLTGLSEDRMTALVATGMRNALGAAPHRPVTAAIDRRPSRPIT